MGDLSGAYLCVRCGTVYEPYSAPVRVLAADGSIERHVFTPASCPTCWASGPGALEEEERDDYEQS